VDWRELVIGLAGVLIGGCLGYYYGYKGENLQIHIGPIEIGRGAGSTRQILGYAVGLDCGVEYWILRPPEDYPAVLGDCDLTSISLVSGEVNPNNHDRAKEYLRNKTQGWGNVNKFMLTKTECTCRHEPRSWVTYKVEFSGSENGELRCATVDPNRRYLEDLVSSGLAFPFKANVKLTTKSNSNAVPSSAAIWSAREPWV